MTHIAGAVHLSSFQSLSLATSVEFASGHRSLQRAHLLSELPRSFSKTEGGAELFVPCWWDVAPRAAMFPAVCVENEHREADTGRDGVPVAFNRTVLVPEAPQPPQILQQLLLVNLLWG